MDPHGVGPSIRTLLTRQDEHRSSLLWDSHLEGEDVPGVLTCRHREKGLLEGGLDGLDPRIVAYITDAGLDELLRVPHMDLDHALITALVERWWPEMHSFHLPHGEMTITLQDIEVIMGVLVDGLSVVGCTSPTVNWRDLCGKLLGHRPPEREPGHNKNTGLMEGPRVKAKWLEDRFSNPLPVDAPEELVQKYARFYIVEMLGGTLFMDKSGERISIRYLQFFDPISNGKKYS
ncbi:serine/threonine-protein phosphatase 7 long form homolog [Quercus lobata]|uniref:serine/threonine-protein phosphatase 7 long form homolog n=1 Tax=Quercus lobata TaxID=97700 RepID=UPI001248727A|nr:serine/threonine-protein phosphatase 7 long form homolog [Quercus lobata]